MQCGINCIITICIIGCIIKIEILMEFKKKKIVIWNASHLKYFEMQDPGLLVNYFYFRTDTLYVHHVAISND